MTRKAMKVDSSHANRARIERAPPVNISPDKDLYFFVSMAGRAVSLLDEHSLGISANARTAHISKSRKTYESNWTIFGTCFQLDDRCDFNTDGRHIDRLAYPTNGCSSLLLELVANFLPALACEPPQVCQKRRIFAVVDRKRDFILGTLICPNQLHRMPARQAFDSTGDPSASNGPGNE